MKKSNTKKNKNCFTLYEQLNPFELINQWLMANLIYGIAESIGDLINGS